MNQEFTLPLPEGGNAQAVLLVLEFVLFVVLDFVSDNFDICHASAIVLAETEILNSSETGGLVLEAWNVLLLDILNGVLMKQVLLEDNVALVILALSAADQSLDEGSDFLCLLESGRDALMQHEIGNEISQHGLSVLGVTAELTDVLLVPHFIIINN